MGCIEVILLDTHTLIWMDQDDPRLGKESRSSIATHYEDDAVCVSAISFWECAMLQAKQRITLPSEVAQWRTELLANGLVELPIDGALAIFAAQLSDLHKDPADRFIAATAIRHGATLITADEKLLASPASLKRLDART